ncbi:Gfo/Idh/MocA family oxidoreductase [Propionibacteriaceae bacterium G57]|uniref:Gfo/Idh/MocA family oxidoreductase n=1 Tax=Aestuariimicrobium sp. G57 TaxID=3418485 RepID=UPI003DA6F180
MTHIAAVGQPGGHLQAFMQAIEALPDVSVDVLTSADAQARAAQFDGVAVFTRDPHEHLAIAGPLLQAGLRVFVDKPLTADPHQAWEVITTAERSGTVVSSASALRWLPGALGWRSEVDEAMAAGELAEVGASGIALPDEQWAGAWYHGVHPVDLLGPWWALASSGLVVDADTDSATVSATRADGVVVRARISAEKQPYRLWWVGRDGTRHERELPVGEGYFGPITERVVGFFAGDDLVGHAECLDVITVTNALVDRWNRVRAH